MAILLHRALIINENRSFVGSVLIDQGIIQRVFEETVPEDTIRTAEVVDADGLWLLPGAIDDHVHFREPGLTHKASIASESKAAVAGGVTSFMEMPNTKPATTTLENWEAKMELAASQSWANYAFYLGATNDNLSELQKADYTRVCGIKLFMGSSTGNMLVDNEKAIIELFKTVPALIAIHAESESCIRANKEKYTALYGESLPVSFHPLIRDVEACYESTSLAIDLAKRYHARLHVLHLSTAKELSLFENKPLEDKHITAEACVPHLWFDDEAYSTHGTAIKCNPAIKSSTDRAALLQAVKDGLIDVIATDHAPHLMSEKDGDALTAASGMPGIQFSLPLLLELSNKGCFSKETVVTRMCHAPAILYRIEKRGFIREGYYADLVLVDPSNDHIISADEVLSTCGWSPFVGEHVHFRVAQTYVNGSLVFDKGTITGQRNVSALLFNTAPKHPEHEKNTHS
jgi:dihydroorotase